MIVGIISAVIALAIIIGLAVYFLRRYIDQRRPPNPTEHDLEMGSINGDNQQVLYGDIRYRRYTGSETPFDLNKVDQ
jgi:hypothetical protein